MTEVSSILGTLVKKVSSSTIENILPTRVIKDEQKKLKNMLEMIQKVLPDAEQKQTKNQAVMLWLSKLKDFCYDFDDVIDEFEVNASRRLVRSTEYSTFKRKVRYLASWIHNSIFQFKMTRNWKELRKRLNKINEEKNVLHLSSELYDKTTVSWGITDSFVPPSIVVGRNQEKIEIMDRLIKSCDDGIGKIVVIPIFGMLGTGKTTLAQLVYNDNRLNKHFHHKVWLSMPREFEIEKIIKDIIVKSLGDKAKYDRLFFLGRKYDRLEMLKDCLRNILKNKRCLFVMDDVWEVGREDWVELRDLLVDFSKGSAVIMTSQNKSIASTVANVPPLDLHPLSWEDSLALFVYCAFDEGQEKNHSDLMIIGKEILNKCGGNPLAVKTLGSLLYSKFNQNEWKYVRDSDNCQLQYDILPSLRMKYDLLPSYLKQCFAYCSIFPKNHEFNNVELIQLWISNGLIQFSGHNQELEEIGQQYLRELFSRFFFDILVEEYPVVIFRMHDLIHDLAISVAQTEYSSMKVRAQDIFSTTRHISFPNPSFVPKDDLRDWLSKPSCVRTIMFEEGSSWEFFLKKCISRFKHLRVLWLDGCSFDLLPSSIGGLKHLRSLNLCNCNIKKLPKSVCKLRHLQHLGLGGCLELKELPADIKNMISLRILSIATKQQRLPESGIGCLTILRWLSILGCENLEALFDDIQFLTSLRTLLIGGCPKLASLPQGIKNLKALEALLIYDCESLKLSEGETDEPCLLRLQSFKVAGLPQMVSFPRWLNGSASTLKIISISDCPNLSVLPEWLQNCFSLRTLEIEGCPRLSSLPDGIRCIATLKKLRIVNPGKWSSCGEEDDLD